MSNGNGITAEPQAEAVRAREPHLRIESLTKMFGSFAALKDISLEVYPGEFVCFLGPSGCGKTTLLRCIAGLDIQTYGRVVQDGRDISALPPTHRDFGIVFQSYALFPNLTVDKNLAYGLENRRINRAEVRKRVAELLDLVGLQGEGPKYPAQLSGGQQQRVALARAVATWPGLLLLDEPLSALDAKVRVHLRHELLQLQRRLGVTTIMVTHDQEEALTLADRIVVMNHGVIEQIGTPVDIYRHPATPFVADFVGTMNFLAGSVLGPGRLTIGKVELDSVDGVDGLEPGAPITVCIRPEDLQLGEPERKTTNMARARVEHLEFLGAYYRATLAIEGIDERVRADFSPTLLRDQAIRGGREIIVTFPDDRMQVFAQPQTRPAAVQVPLKAPTREPSHG